MRRLWINVTSFILYVILFIGTGFYIATHYLDNEGTTYVFAIVWTILVFGSGLGIMGKR